ncbi:hypothetical protein FCV25MIE_13076, partial [Fagus crenata]
RGSWRRGPHCRSSLLLNGGDDVPRGSAVHCLQILATSLRSVPILNSSKYLEVENRGVARGRRRNESSVKELEDSIENVGKLGFDLGSLSSFCSMMRKRLGGALPLSLGDLLAIGAGLELIQVAVKTLESPVEAQRMSLVSKSLRIPLQMLESSNSILDMVVKDHEDVILVATALLLLLDGGDDAPRGSALRYLQI